MRRQFYGTSQEGRFEGRTRRLLLFRNVQRTAGRPPGEKCCHGETGRKTPSVVGDRLLTPRCGQTFAINSLHLRLYYDEFRIILLSNPPIGRKIVGGGRSCKLIRKSF